MSRSGFLPPSAGSVAIVTGASAGLGRAFARELSARGHVVLAVARRDDRLRQLADEARAAGGGRIEPLALDVTTEDAAERVAAAARALGPIGWLVNNAGASTFGRFEDADVAQARGLVRLNCESIVMLTGVVLPDLVRAGRGIILQVASSAGMQPAPGWAVYGASKAFVLSFGEALIDELGGSGVSVTVLCPGPIVSEFFHEAEEARAPRPWDMTPQACARVGVEAALAGKAVVVPGLATRLLTFSSRLGPRALVRWVSGRIGLRYIGLSGLPPRPPRASLPPAP